MIEVGIKVLKKIKPLVIFILLLTLISSAYAQEQKSNILVQLDTIKTAIFEDEIANFEITITNNADFDEYFLTPYTTEADWIVTTDPLVIHVPAHSTAKFTAFIDPKATISPDQYALTLNIESQTTGSVDMELLLIFVKPLNPLPQGYVSSIALNVEMPTEIDPKEQIPVSIYMRNRNAKQFDNLTVTIKSGLLNKNYTTPFAALEEKTEEFTFTIDKYTPPQQDTVIATISDGDEIINTVKIPIRVISYSEIIEEKTVVERFLATKTTITLTNEGNIPNEEPYTYELGFIKDISTYSKPEGYITNTDNRYLTFQKTLSPGESTTIYVETNYRYLLYIIILLIALVITYYQVRSPIVAKKEAIVHEQQSEGVSEFKVKILIKNRSQRPVENCKVIEAIPSLATLIKEQALGTIEPTKIIKNDKRGTLIRWDINYLEPFEERIITYKIKSTLNIVGSLTLPPTKIKFETIRGRERVTHSRKTKIKIYA